MLDFTLQNTCAYCFFERLLLIFRHSDTTHRYHMPRSTSFRLSASLVSMRAA